MTNPARPDDRSRENADTPGGVSHRSDALCRRLAQPGAWASADPFDDRRLRIVVPRNGVSRVEASLPAHLADALVAEDLARWEAPADGRARLVATEAGLARAARLAAPAGVDPFLAQHGVAPVARTARGGDAAPALRNDAESPLSWLRNRQARDGVAFIDEAGFAAGERLRADFDRARMLPRVTADWSGAVRDAARGPFDPAAASDAVIAARQRVDKALDAVGHDLAGLLVDVCGFLKGLSAIEAERRWPARSAKVVLKLALDRLAAHYGLQSEARGPSTARRYTAWMADGARPLF